MEDLWFMLRLQVSNAMNRLLLRVRHYEGLVNLNRIEYCKPVRDVVGDDKCR